MNTWEFDWHGHHFEIEEANSFWIVGETRTSILRIDGKIADRRKSSRFGFTFGHATPTLTAAVAGADGQIYLIRADFSGWTRSLEVLANGDKIFEG